MTVRANGEAGPWHSVRERLRQRGLDDVYFAPEYTQLYEDRSNASVAFVYEDDEDVFLLPYLRQQIPNSADEEYDFETAYGYGGPVATTDNQGFLDAAWAAFLASCRHQGIICGFLRFHPLLGNVRFARPSAVDTVFMRHTVKMSLQNRTEDDVWQQYRSDTRNKINKAKRNGVEVRKERGREPILRFAQLYRQAMSDVGAADFYRFGDRYFERLALGLPEDYDVYAAYLDGRCVGGALTLHCRDYVHLHLSGTNQEARKLGVANLIRHTAIVDHIGRRQSFHFGGGTTNDPKDSLLRYKQGFSPELAEFWVGKVVVDEGRYRQMCTEWERAYPDRAARYGRMFLKYRF